jgi:hypothetical protein
MLGGAERSMRTQNPKLALLSVLLLAARAGFCQEREALLLPQDAQIIDEKSVRGSTEQFLQPGLSRMRFPDSSVTYYVVDEVAALQARISDQLGDIGRNDSDISIQFDFVRNEGVHIRLRS